MQNELTFFAHDIRNVSAVIGLDADQLLTSTDPCARRVGDRIHRVAERLDAMCQSITSAPTSKPLLNGVVEHCNVVAVINEVAELAPRTEWPVQIDVCAPTELITEVCSNSLFRILHNLISNAVKATGAYPDGQVKITARSTRIGIDIHIIDNAFGLPKLQRQKFQSPSTASLRAGRYGLSAAQSLAGKIGGDLRLQATGALGTHFRLTIPTADSVGLGLGVNRVQIGPLSHRERALCDDVLDR